MIARKNLVIVIPYALRSVISETIQYLLIAGITDWRDLVNPPMNLMIKTIATAEDETTQRVQVFYEGGFRIKAEVICGEGHFGGTYEITKLSLRWKGHAAEKNVAKIQIWSGPGEIKRTPQERQDESITLTLTGHGLMALRCNASWVRNSLPTHQWDDVEHPRHQWAA